MNLAIFDAIRVASKTFHEKQMEEAEALINELWGIYNTGSSKSLSVENVQTMMEEIAGLEELDTDQVQDFLMTSTRTIMVVLRKMN